MSDPIPFRERISCTLNEAAQATGLSADTLYRRIDSGELRAVIQGGRRLIIVGSLIAMIESAPAKSPRAKSPRVKNPSKNAVGGIVGQHAN